MVNRAVVLVLASAALAACGREPTASGPRQVVASVNGPDGEAEVFGYFYHTNTTGVTIGLNTVAGGGATGSAMPIGGHAVGVDWGWIGRGFVSLCPREGNSPPNTEVHRPHIGTQPEEHCVWPGRYQIMGIGGAFGDGTELGVIDWIHYAYPVTFPGTTIHVASEDAIYQPTSTQNWETDVVFNYDGQSAVAPTLVLRVDVTSDPLGAPWPDVGTYQGGTVNLARGQFLRVGAWESYGSWALNDRGRLLVRYFWNGLDHPDDATGYGPTYGPAVIDGWNFARVKQFNTQGDYNVVAVLRQPGSALVTRTIPVHVAAPPPPPFDSVRIWGVYSPQSAVLRQNQGACEWRADAFGGVAPFTYAWTQNGTPLPDSTRFLTLPVYSAGFTLGLTVTDAVGRVKQASKTVSVSKTGILCP